MKILLINPPSPGDYPFTREGRCMQREGVWTTVWPPMSLCTMGSILREKGFDVRINDCPSEGINGEGLKDVLKEFQPDLLLFSSSTPSINFDATIPSLVKETLPDIKIGTFGIHAGALPDEVFRMSPNLDFILRGEPEYTAVELAEALKSGADLKAVNGLSYRLDGSVTHNTAREFFPDLDEIPFPAWDLVDLSKYTLPFSGRRFLMVMSSRGCPYDCTFCVAQSYYGKKIRKRSAKRIVDEIEYCIDKFGITDFFFWSESFTIVKKNIHQLCDEILNRDLKIKWVCNSRVDSVDRPVLERMKEAGCWMISYGVESGDQGILDRAMKRITLEQIEDAVKLTREVCFQMAGHFVLGLPGETEETLRKTGEMSKRLDLDYAQFYCAAPWPGSRFYDEALSSGWLNTDNWDKFEQTTMVVDYPEVSGERIMELRDKMVRNFYFRPKLIWKTFKKIKGWNEMKNFMNMVRAYLDWI